MSASHLRPAWQLPLQWPHAAQQRSGDRHAVNTERLLKAAIVLALLALTVLDRFGLRLTAGYSIPPALVAMYGLVALMAVAGAAELSPRGALAYVAVATVAALSFVVNASFAGARVSMTSFLLLMVLYAPFAVSLGRGAATPELWRWVAKMYVAFALFVAAAGIAQFFAQFAFRPGWLFDYSALIPAPISRSGNWNTVNPAGEWIKSNGFFLREASIFSIAMAFALLCELSLARRKWVMAILAMGLVLTYSGSGLLCLAVALLFPLGRRSLLRLLACLALAATLYVLLGDALNLSYTVNRVKEFDSEKSSAYCRFVFPAVVALQQMDSSPWAAVLGHGPGTMPKMDSMCAESETTYGKALFEYGLAGMLAFGALILGALGRSRAPIRIRVALGLSWLLLGGNLLTSEFLLLIFMFCAMWPPGTAAESVKPQGAA
jgi:hypothetical protein